MKVLVDSNVIIDVLTRREPFYNDSNSALERLFRDGSKLYVSSSSITDIYYLLRKRIGNHKRALEEIKKLAGAFDIAEVNQQCIIDALQSKMSDFEDAVIDSVAANIGVNIILTRNKKDFKEAKTKICTPDEFKWFRLMTPDELKNHYVGRK